MHQTTGGENQGKRAPMSAVLLLALLVGGVVVGCAISGCTTKAEPKPAVDPAASGGAKSVSVAAPPPAAPVQPAPAATAPVEAAEAETPVSLVDSIEYDSREIKENVAYLNGDKEGMTVKAWMAARMKSAKNGAPELVRIPLAHKCVGWGCECPDHYIGTNTGTEGVAWLTVATGPHARLPEDPGRDGFVRVVDGYFTGQQSAYKWEDDGKVLDTYKLHEFHVLRSRPYKEGKDDVLKLLLSGAESQRQVPALSDDRPWLAIVSSIPYGTPESSEKIESLMQRLKDKGFGDAAFFDSRSAPLLFCCFHIVVAGRFQTSGEAQKVVKQLKSSGFKDAYVQNGW